MNRSAVAFVAFPLVAVLALAGCASRPVSPSPSSGAASSTGAAKPHEADDDSRFGPMQTVRSRDGRFEGELFGSVVPDGKFSKLQIGMQMNEVLVLIGGPDAFNGYETGKRWIPFYFGGDARRIEVLYKGEGCLTYTGGNAWGGGDPTLIRIVATPRSDCIG